MVDIIKYLVIDVDGTMTDAGIYYDEHGNEMKKFCTKDAAGFFAARQVGIKIIVLTGRQCELKVDFLFQNVKDKKTFLEQFMRDNMITKDEMGYIGDDLNDLPPMKLAGFVGCPFDSCQEIISISDYHSSLKGGNGAVRDVIEHYLRDKGLWDNAVQNVYGIGT